MTMGDVTAHPATIAAMTRQIDQLKTDKELLRQANGGYLTRIENLTKDNAVLRRALSENTELLLAASALAEKVALMKITQIDLIREAETLLKKQGK
jgi:hypothetical protein